MEVSIVVIAVGNRNDVRVGAWYVDVVRPGLVIAEVYRTVVPVNIGLVQSSNQASVVLTSEDCSLADVGLVLSNCVARTGLVLVSDVCLAGTFLEKSSQILP